MTRSLTLILGDQLSDRLAALQATDPDQDVVVMAEVREEASYVPHHPQKIILLFSAMRHFAAQLQERGFKVDYYHYEQGIPDLLSAVRQSARKHGSASLRVTMPGEYRLDRALREDWPGQSGLQVEILEDDRFVCSPGEFRRWASGRKQLRMEYFYREMRKKTGLLMEPDGKPCGDRWNFDADNRKRYDGRPQLPPSPDRTADPVTREVIELIKKEFPDRFGDPEPFCWPVTRAQALSALEQFIDQRLPSFGDFQDAMVNGQAFLFHSLLSTSLNCGLLTPLEVCEAAEQAWRRGDVPLNAAEGFIRQIIGWREYVRGIYWLCMPDYGQRNELDSERPLPGYFWNGETRMACMADAFRHTREHAYSHHIQRLMVTGNFALIAGLSVTEIHQWYLAVYADAYEWVELPNTLGMVMHADGGLLGSKPYAASGKYIHRMSDHCRSCHYRVTTAEEPDSCPFNSLYWHFMNRHRARFSEHPRMGMIYRSWEKMASDRRHAILARAEEILERLDQL